MPTRRLVLAALPLLAAPPALAAGKRPLVCILGDSITTGFGLPPAAALPAQFQRALDARGVRAQVRGAGVNGDTTAGGLARLDRAVPQGTAVCVVALGANDLLLGSPAGRIEANLERIVRRLQGRGIAVVVAGGSAPAWIPPAERRAFQPLFATVARRRGALATPDLTAGIVDRPAMLQADGLHPNAAGARLIAERLAPVVARALAVRRAA
jgi:acyl-CoA thioesterase-1